MSAALTSTPELGRRLTLGQHCPMIQTAWHAFINYFTILQPDSGAVLVQLAKIVLPFVQPI